MLSKRKLLPAFIALGVLIAVVVMEFVLPGRASHPTYAQSGVTMSEYWLSGGQQPWGTTFDSHGNVWVAIPGCDPAPACNGSTPPGKIEEFNPASSSWSATYQLPNGYGQALFLAFDAQGNLWFPLPMANSIGELNLGSKTFKQWAVPTAGAGPWDIAIDRNGNIWFTEHFINKIGEFNPVTQTFTEIATPAGNSQPYGIMVDGSNNIWFTENNSSVALIGEYYAGGKLKEYKIRNNPPGGLTPHLITVDTNGNIWWSEGWVGMIGELKVSQAVPGTDNGVTEYAYPATCNTCGGTHTSGISIDGYGQIWFSDALQNIIGSFPESGSGSFSIYQVPTSNAHPHDGLNVDNHNVVWFTEEFGNKLGKAVQNNPPPPSPTPTKTPTSTPTPAVSPSPSVSPTPSPSPGTTIAQDTFQRKNQSDWGTASDGLKWGGDANSSSVFAISNNTGQASNGSTNYSAVLGPIATNAQVLFSGSISNFNNTNFGGVLRWTDGNNWYKAYIDGSNLVIQKKVNGNTTILKQVSFSAKANTSYTIRFSITGTTLAAKVWQTGTTEPSSWMATATDSTFASGFCGLRMLVENNAVLTITSFQATAQ
jgi:streptogramin lyase